MESKFVGWAAVVSLALVGYGCGPPGGGGGGGGPDGGSGDSMGGGPDENEVASCNLGSFEIKRIDAQGTEEIYTSLPNRYAVATKTGGQARQGVHVEFGMTEQQAMEREAFSEASGLIAGITFIKDGSSGQIVSDGSKLGAESIAFNREGPYIGKKSGTWGADRVKQTGDWSGSWNLSAYEEGERVTGTVTFTLDTLCSPSLSSSIEYEASFDVPLVEEDSADQERCTLAEEGATFSPGRPLGTVQNVTVGGDSWEEPNGVTAFYAADDGLVGVGIESGDRDRILDIGVQNPKIGDNVPQGGYKNGDCEYQVKDPGANTFTIDDNGSGNVSEGPTEGSFSLELKRTSGSDSQCKSSPLEMTGDFGLAACQKNPF